MTSKTSLNKFHPALNLFNFSVRKNSGLTILITIFMLLICPGYILTYINQTLKGTGTLIYNFDKISGTLITSIAVFTSVIAIFFCFLNFSYLYSKKSSDVFHALPLTRKGLLFSKYLASVIPVLIPTAVSYISMLILLCFKTISGDCSKILFGMIYNVLLILLCTAFTMIFIICAGSLADLILSFFAVNIGIVLSAFTLAELGQNYMLGFSSSSMETSLLYLSPFLFAFIKFFYFLSDGFSIGSGILVYTVKIILLTVGSLLVSYFLYNKRKSEKSGVSYAYKFIYIIGCFFVAIVGSFALGVIFGNGCYNAYFWIFSAIGAVLSAITFGAINDRGFKTVKKSVIIGCSSIAIIALTAVIMHFGGLGYAKRIPQKNSVKSVTVQFGGNCIEFNDTDEVMDLHENIVSNLDELKTNDYSKNSVIFSYSLKGGFSMERQFFIDPSEYMDYLLNIYTSDENINSIKKNMEQFDGSSLTLSKSDYYYENGEATKDSEITGEPIYDVYITKPELDAIIGAFTSDIKKATDNSINEMNVTAYCFNGMDENHHYLSYSIYVEDGFKNTQEVLNSLHLNERMKETEQQMSEEKYQ